MKLSDITTEPEGESYERQTASPDLGGSMFTKSGREYALDDIESPNIEIGDIIDMGKLREAFTVVPGAPGPKGIEVPEFMLTPTIEGKHEISIRINVLFPPGVHHPGPHRDKLINACRFGVGELNVAEYPGPAKVGSWDWVIDILGFLPDRITEGQGRGWVSEEAEFRAPNPTTPSPEEAEEGGKEPSYTDPRWTPASTLPAPGRGSVE